MKTYALMRADGLYVFVVGQCETEAGIIDHACEEMGDGVRDMIERELSEGKISVIEVADADEAYWLRDEISRWGQRFRPPPAQGSLFTQKTN